MSRIIKIFSFILLTTLILFLSVCTEKQQTYSLIDTEWEVLSITAPDRIFILISPTPYPVKFLKDITFTIGLDVNTCGGTYSLDNENYIHINTVYCTKICCDSVFADTLINIFRDIYSYKIVEDNLELIATNRIINLRNVLVNSN